MVLFTLNGSVIQLVQPSNPSLHVRPSDFRLLLKFPLTKRQTLMTTSLWYPVCLKSLNSNGYAQCYAQCVHKPTGLCFMWVGANPDTALFHKVQRGSQDICDGIMDGANFDECKVVKDLLESETNLEDRMFHEYTKISKALHFKFIFHSFVSNGSNYSNNSSSTFVTQSITPQLRFPFVSEESKTEVYEHYYSLRKVLYGDDYDKLFYNFSHGAQNDDEWKQRQQQQQQQQEESVSRVDEIDEFYVINNRKNIYKASYTANGCAYVNFAYIKTATLLYAGMIGLDYDVYAVFNNNMLPADVIRLMGDMVSKIRSEKDNVFVTPGTF